MTEVQRTQRTLALTGEMRRTRRRTCTAFRVMTGTCVKLQKSVIVASGDGRIKGSCVLCVDESRLITGSKAARSTFLWRVAMTRMKRDARSGKENG